MTDQSKAGSAAEDLAYIRRIMEDTRRAIVMRGDYFIAWGMALLAAMIGNYILIQLRLPGWTVGALWAASMLIGWSASMLIARREREERVAAPFGRVIGTLWAACGLAIVIICFAGIPLGVMSPFSVGPVICALVGIPVFVTGMLMGTRWVGNLAFGWWVGAILEFIWNSDVQLLIGAVLIILLYIIPGFILNAQARRLASGSRA